MKRFTPFLLLGALGASVPAHAVVLENKWQAGQKLPYDVTLDGTLNLQADAGAPVLWAGMPLDVAINGRTTTIVDTLEVGGDGTAKIALRMPLVSLRGETMGQKVEWSALDGTSRFTMNGKTLAAGKPGDVAILQNPPVALKISRRGRLTGLEPIQKPAEPKPDARGDDTPPPAPGAMEGAVMGALDQNALVQALILRALPMLWPTDDLKAGQDWKAVVGWPTAPGQPAEAPLGEFALKLIGEEVIEGKTLERISLDGALKADEHKISMINEGAAAQAKATDKPAGLLRGLEQNIKGDLWFDAQAGQVVRAELKMKGFVDGEGPAKNGRKGPESRAEWNGTMVAQLKQN